MIAALLHKIRAWRIEAMQQDMQRAADCCDVYLHDQAERLAELRRKQYAGMTSDQIARMCEARAKAL